MSGLRRHIPVLLTVLLIASQALAAASSLVRSAAPGEAFVTDAVLGKLVLCLAHASKGSHAPSEQQRGVDNCCPLCGAPHAPPPDLKLARSLAPLALPGTIAWHALGLPTLAEHLRLGGISGRGPPARA